MGAAAKDVPLMVPGQAGIIMEVAEGGFYVGAHSRYLNHSNENYLYLAVQ